MNVHIETERLILRPILDIDLKEMFELDSDPEVHKYLGNNPIKKKEEAQKAINYIKKQYQEHGIGRWAVVNKATNEFMGWSGLKFNTKEESYNPNFSNFYDVGYRFIKRFWGKGYATESGKSAINYAFNTLKLKTVYATTEMGNESSHNALLKIGFDYVENYVFEIENQKHDLRWYKIEKH